MSCAAHLIVNSTILQLAPIYDGLLAYVSQSIHHLTPARLSCLGGVRIGLSLCNCRSLYLY
jgi:hypothetical protein